VRPTRRANDAPGLALDLIRGGLYGQRSSEPRKICQIAANDGMICGRPQSRQHKVNKTAAGDRLPRPVSPAPICVALNQEDFLGCQGEGFPMRLRVLVLAAGLLWPVSSFSQDRVSQSFETGYQLYDDCNAALGSPQNIFCMGYVMGVSDSLDSQRLMCIPQEDTAAQEMSVVVNFLRDHPEERQDTAYSVVKLALMEAFPCK
jgi:hypothetical protein